jgi:hypothetical protein
MFVGMGPTLAQRTAMSCQLNASQIRVQCCDMRDAATDALILPLASGHPSSSPPLSARPAMRLCSQLSGEDTPGWRSADEFTKRIRREGGFYP